VTIEEKKSAEAVWFVGAGPGDARLITVRGRELLEGADLVVYTGSLVGAQSLCWCREEAEMRSSAGMHLDEIVSLMASAAREGRRVVRLHTGDPSLYGAIGEQIDALARLGIESVIVPGVSSASASAASLGIELTVPGGAQTVILTRIEGRTPVPEAESLSSLAAHRATVCIFLSVSMIEKVAGELLKGYAPSTPAAVVYRASWEDERIIRGTLADIAAKTKEAGITRHALIIVGEAVGGSAGRGVSRLYDKSFSHGYRGE